MEQNLSHLKDAELLLTTKSLVEKERAVTAEVLKCINEIELRRLHLVAGFSSLHEFLVKQFGYCDGSAHRRIAAARLLRTLPKVVEPALMEGRVNLTTVALAEDFFVSERRDFKKEYSLKQKEDLLFSITSKSRRQCEEVFQRISPERASLPKLERVRVMGSATDESSLEVLLTLTPEFQIKLTRIKELLSHHPESQKSYAELFELMADQLLKRVDPLLKARNKTKREKVSQDSIAAKSFANPKDAENNDQQKEIHLTSPKFGSKSNFLGAQNGGQQNSALVSPPKVHGVDGDAFTAQPKAFPGKFTLPMDLNFLAQAYAKSSPKNPTAFTGRTISIDSVPKKPSRYIPAHVKSFVYQRDSGQCTYLSPLTRERCKARKFLHIDHVQPLALGGETTIKNCRLLCAQHNALAAVQVLGSEIMGTYIQIKTGDGAQNAGSGKVAGSEQWTAHRTR